MKLEDRTGAKLQKKKKKGKKKKGKKKKQGGKTTDKQRNGRTKVATPAPTPIETPPQGRCPPAHKEISLSYDVSLDGGWIKINCEVCLQLHNAVRIITRGIICIILQGGCIQVTKCMAGCQPGTI